MEKNRRMVTGTVVSTKMIKTAVVAVTHVVKHPLYKKALRITRRIAAHNELKDLMPGDTVSIAETRPMSKRKHFTIIEKIR